MEQSLHLAAAENLIDVGHTVSIQTVSDLIPETFAPSVQKLIGNVTCYPTI